MSSPREGPNPLRPYYVPPSIGPSAPPSTSTPATSDGIGASGKHVPSTSPAAETSFSSSARDLFSDLDYSNYLSDASPSVTDTVKRLVDQALWKYTSVLMAQPFEVAKTILQCHLAIGPDDSLQAERAKRRPDYHRGRSYGDYGSDESDPDEPAYFTTNTASPHIVRRRRDFSYSDDDLSSGGTSKHASRPPGNFILSQPSSLLEALSQLWAKEGAWGVWKGANSTFIYNVLLKSAESWIRSLLAALFNLPDASLLSGSVDIADGPFPMASLGVAVAAAGLAGALLSPLDIVRTQLMLTPTSHSPRSLVPALRALPSSTCPLDILPVTILHSTLPTLISTSTPMFLRSRLGVDPILTPITFSAFTFLSACADLVLRLPLETVLRRGQIHTVFSTSPTSPTSATTTPTLTAPASSRQTETIVPIGSYNGIIGTMWTIVREEGERTSTPAASRVSTPTTRRASKEAMVVRRKGQGLEGLWRGWRVGMWGLVGMWGAAALGNAGKGGEF